MTYKHPQTNLNQRIYQHNTTDTSEAQVDKFFSLYCIHPTWTPQLNVKNKRNKLPWCHGKNRTLFREKL